MKKSIAAFTLIELLVVIAIASILAVIAIPNFSDMVRKNQVQTQLKGFASLMKYARSEAVSSRRTISVCPLTLTNKCDGTGDWSDQLTVFFNDNENDTLELPAVDTIKIFYPVGQNTLTVKDSANTDVDMISFESTGAANTSMTVRVCESSKDVKKARAVIIAASGMAIHSRINSATGVYKDINATDLVCP